VPNGLLSGKVEISDGAPQPKVTLLLDGTSGDVVAGGNGQIGAVTTKNQTGTEIGRLGHAFAPLPGAPPGTPASPLASGMLQLKTHTGQETIALNGATGGASVATIQAVGVSVTDKDGKQTIRLSGMTGDVEAGGNGQIGAVISKNQTGTVIGRLGHTFAPLPGSPPGSPPFPIANGQLVLSTHDGHETITLNGAAGSVAASHVVARGVVATNLSARDLRVENTAGKDTIHIDGETGDILLLNADCAEEFPVSDRDQIEPGNVMIIEGEDRLRRCERAYDRRVAGVVSGAGDCKPGIVLGKRETASDTVAIALIGKVYCKADARYAPIEIGDLLTTSTTPGHAMKASDTVRLPGAVIGKALMPLESGMGLIPILVALQ